MLGSCKLLFVFRTFEDGAHEQQRYHANTYFSLFSVYPEGLKGHTLLHVAKLKEVTERDLGSNFTCFAENSVGNATAMIQLKRKQRGKTINGWLFALEDTFWFAAMNSFCIDTLASCRHFLKLDGRSLICQISRKSHYSDYLGRWGYMETYCRQVGQVEAGEWLEEEESSISQH